jgi:hypothetical protein
VAHGLCRAEFERRRAGAGVKYTMRRPCSLCPFTRTGLALSPERAQEIGEQIVTMEGEAGRGLFVCHETAEVRGEEGGGYVPKDDGSSYHCAGALIFAEKQEAPTQLMRIMERLRAYDRRLLDMDADVFDNLREMVEHNRGRL